METSQSNKFVELREQASLTLNGAAEFLRRSLSDIERLENGTSELDLGSELALKGLSMVSSMPESFVPELGSSKLKIFSFFSGAGFLDLGFEKSGYDVEFVNEYHQPFLDAYKFSRKQMGIRGPAFGYNNQSIADLESSKSSRFLRSAIADCKATGSLVGFVGGPPCPDFSVAGKNKGQSGEKGRLSKTYVDLICKHKPDFFLFENVRGLWRTKKHRAFFDTLQEQLIANGYQLKAEVLNALSFDAPQDRERIILFGIKKKLARSIKKDITEFNWQGRNATELLKLEWPKKTDFIEDSVLSRPNHIPLDLTVQYWFEKNDVENHPNSKHHFQPRAGLIKFQSVLEGDTDKKSYKRVHRWRYSPTAAYGNNEVHLHPYKARRISAAEAMSIQSLPKEFVLPSNMTLSNMFKTIGNGVPFLMAKGMAEQIKEFLMFEEDKP